MNSLLNQETLVRSAAPLGTAHNPVTNASATRPNLPVVWWETTTQPTNWNPGSAGAAGDKWINNS